MRCRTCAGEIMDDSRYGSLCGTEVMATGPDIATAARSGGSALVAVPSAVAPVSLPECLSGRALPYSSSRAGLGGETQDQRATSGNARRLNAHSVHQLLTQANLYRMRGQFTEAIDCCVAVLRVQSANATAHLPAGGYLSGPGETG